VQPLSNLIATDQIREGDSISVNFDKRAGCMSFVKDGEGVPVYVIAEAAEALIPISALAQTNRAGASQKGLWRRAS
jgi:hypothetical protein